MAKSAIAKRGAGRGQSKAPTAPPAKKPRKATHDVENVDPKGDTCVKKAKLSGARSSEEAKKSREEVLKPVVVDASNVAPEQDVDKEKSHRVAPSVSPSKTSDVMVTPADPVSQGVAIVQNAFEDEKQMGLLELPAHVREILRIAVPTALGIGSAADERHDMQIQTVNAIGSYLQEVMERCMDQAKKEEDLVQATKITKEQQTSTLATFEATLEEKILLLSEKDSNLSNAEQAVSAAKATVPQQEMEELDAELQKTRSERDQYQKVITSSFDVLKACDWSSSAEQKKGEKKLFGPLNTLVKQIGADPSLVEAASNALAKNPSQRGDFDVMVVGQLEAVLRQPLTVLDEQIHQQEIVKQQKDAQMQEGNATVALMEQQLSTCYEELAACKKEKKDLEHRIKELMSTSKDSDQKLEQARIAHDTKVSLLEQANKSLAAFRFLHERRVTPLPEPVAEMSSTITEETSKENPPAEGADAPMPLAEMSSTITEESTKEIPADACAAASMSPAEMASTITEESSKEVPAENACVDAPMSPAQMWSTVNEEAPKEIPAEIACATVPTSAAEMSSAVTEEPIEEISVEIALATAPMSVAEMSSTITAEPSEEIPVEIKSPDTPISPAEMSCSDITEDPSKEIPSETVCADGCMAPVVTESPDVPMQPSVELTPSLDVDPQSPEAEVNPESPEAEVEAESQETAADNSLLPAADTLVHEADVEDSMEECAEEADPSLEQADPCWEFVQGLEPGSDPFFDKKSSSTDSSKLKEECMNLKAVAVTTAGRIKFSLPPRSEWVPPRGDEDNFGTWVWRGHDDHNNTEEQ